MIAAVMFTAIDWLVLVGYFAGMLWLGLYFAARNKTADDFSAGGRSLPGWLCGLSIFATYLSSISYLALPGKAFVDNWNPFVYSLALPLAAVIAVRFFVPLYRRSGEISAYSWLEKRFGLWARIFASSFYLLYQIARIGVVMYLMALPMAVLFGWDIRIIIVFTGIIVTAYSFVGGIVAVIWADAIQAVVLLAGAGLALAIIVMAMPGGVGEVIQTGRENGKFSLGSASVSNVSTTTIWVMLAFGLFDNLRNFGVDQSYVQRYIAAGSDREAAKSVWLGSLLYVPVSALFFFIGSSLYAYYQSHPIDMQQVRVIVAEQRLMQQGVPIESADYQDQIDQTANQLQPVDLGDRVFPHFIASKLPRGIRGLLIAAIFAAAMSTVSTSLNSAATLAMTDFYRRLFKADADDRQQIRMLRTATIAWGVMGTMMALTLVQLTDSVLDIWWMLSGVLGAAIIGLFLLGLMVPRLANRSAIVVAAIGIAVITWIAISNTARWPDNLIGMASPFHPYLVIVVGPLVMVIAGWLFSMLQNGGGHPNEPETTLDPN